MHAFKVLAAGRSPFTRFAWPRPRDGAPGAWVEARGQLELCAHGIHACDVDQLPQWLGDELWRVELDGEIVRTDAALIASRARMLEPVQAWDRAARTAFGEACAVRARPVARDERLVSWIEKMTGEGHAAAAGYWAAVAAGERKAGRRSGLRYDEAFAAERAAQADWLRTELGLSA